MGPPTPGLIVPPFVLTPPAELGAGAAIIFEQVIAPRMLQSAANVLAAIFSPSAVASFYSLMTPIFTNTATNVLQTLSRYPGNPQAAVLAAVYDGPQELLLQALDVMLYGNLTGDFGAPPRPNQNAGGGNSGNVGSILDQLLGAIGLKPQDGSTGGSSFITPACLACAQKCLLELGQQGGLSECLNGCEECITAAGESLMEAIANGSIDLAQLIGSLTPGTGTGSAGSGNSGSSVPLPSPPPQPPGPPPIPGQGKNN